MKEKNFIQTFQRPCVRPIIIRYPAILNIIKPEVRIRNLSIPVQSCVNISGNNSGHRNTVICIRNNPGASEIDFYNATMYQDDIIEHYCYSKYDHFSFHYDRHFDCFNKYFTDRRLVRTGHGSSTDEPRHITTYNVVSGSSRRIYYRGGKSEASCDGDQTGKEEE